MKLRLLVPTGIVVDQHVAKIVAEGVHGSFCLLPRHVDFLAALVPGLLSFEDTEGKEHFVAVDEAILVKRGDDVLVSARQAVQSADLEHLRTTVLAEFAAVDDRTRAAQTASAKLEASLLRSLMELTEERA